MNDNPLHLIMNPKSIATVGSGNNFMKMGTLHALSIINDGFKGAFYPVHPKDETVLGHKAYASVPDLPEAPDLAILIVPVHTVADILEDFGKIGTRRAIIVTAGFRETGDDGKRQEEKLTTIADKYGIRFIGPNCMGIINTEVSLNTTVLSYEEKPGNLGLISQSGTYVTQSIPYIGKRGISFSKAVSVGNSANITLTDVLEYMGDDDQTRAISMYIEAVPDIERFIEVARKITPRKPVLAQYVSGSEAGARSSQSHTGAMAAPDHLYDGLFKQAGIIRVNSIEDLFGYGTMLASQPRLKGSRVGVITNSGGPGSAMANTLEEGGFDVPEFSASLQEEIKPLMPAHAPCGNPVDLTFSMDISVLTNQIPDLVMKSGEVDGVVMHGVMRSGYIKSIYPHLKKIIGDMPIEALLEQLPNNADQIVKPPFEHGVPMAVSSFFDRDDDYIEAYQNNGIPVYNSPEKAAGAMVSMLQYYKVHQRKPYKKPAIPEISKDASAIIKKALAAGQGALDEHESKKFLQCYGLPVTDETTVNSGEEAMKAAHETGFPLVMKASAHDILHKTGKGLIYLDVQSADEAVESYDNIQIAAGRQVPVIMYNMVKGDRELVAGMMHYPGFGPSVMFGLGGIFTEALEDTVFRPAPMTEEDALEMINDIRSQKLLADFRGMPAVNRDAVAKILHVLSVIPVLHPEVQEIDCNPMIIEGAEPVIVDALVALKG